jgi:hypothetical protein
MAFWIFWGIDAVIALVFLIFFVIGLADGSVSSFNIVLWLGILLALGGVLWGGPALRAAGQRGAALAVVLLLAVPGILFALFFLLLIILNPRWN